MVHWHGTQACDCPEFREAERLRAAIAKALAALERWNKTHAPGGAVEALHFLRDV